MIVGEIGENDCQDSYINPLMTWLDTNGGSYLAWAWNTYDCSSFPSLVSDYSGTPTNYGVGFKSHLAALNEMHDTHDFNGDGNSDIAWRDGNGDYGVLADERRGGARRPAASAASPSLGRSSDSAISTATA